MTWTVRKLGYLPSAATIGLDEDEFPTGVGVLFIESDDGRRVTRAGQPDVLIKLALADQRLTAEAAMAGMPYVRPGWITDEQTGEGTGSAA